MRICYLANSAIPSSTANSIAIIKKRAKLILDSLD
tara:strand:+ start:721 stop:825 length:105 start_codon:yes stop_codon:yes gene_type:complete